VVRNVSEEPTASIFRESCGGSRFLRNVGVSLCCNSNGWSKAVDPEGRLAVGRSAVRVGFVVDKAELGQIFLAVLLSSPVSYSTAGPYSFIYHRRNGQWAPLGAAVG
jgi:hypothetical protein